MAAAYTLKRLTDVADSAPGLGVGAYQESRFATDDLDAKQTGVTHHRFKPGMRQKIAHRHDQAEEIYVVLAGFGRIKLNDEIFEIEALDAIRVSPGVIRSFEAGPQGLDVLAVGAHHDGDGEVFEDWWID
jgi:mannose-6-phosphate isomerase-like protein (cupin superfamily)